MCFIKVVLSRPQVRLYKGRIVKTAGPELALELEEKGYDWIKKEMGDL